MSGGEQQMLAMGRALMCRPKLLLLDEPSMGLSPIMVDKIFEVVQGRGAQGVTVLLCGCRAGPVVCLAFAVAPRQLDLQVVQRVDNTGSGGGSRRPVLALCQRFFRR